MPGQKNKMPEQKNKMPGHKSYIGVVVSSFFGVALP